MGGNLKQTPRRVQDQPQDFAGRGGVPKSSSLACLATPQSARPVNPTDELLGLTAQVPPADGGRTLLRRSASSAARPESPKKTSTAPTPRPPRACAG